MRIVQFTKSSVACAKPRLGLRLGDHIIDFQEVCTKIPNTLIELLSMPNGLQRLKEFENYDFSKVEDKIPIGSVTLLPPITRPDKVLCAGMNYADHCAEQNVPLPKEPMFFSKFASNLIGPFDFIPYPEGTTTQLDYEVELAFIIAKTGKNIPKENAMDYVLGYTIAHDVSARDWQLSKNGGQWLLGKAMDGFCPIGPEIVTKDEIPNPHTLGIRCKVNGNLKQNSNTKQMLHKIDAIVSFLSKLMTLLPGDIILTGTPPGVGVFQKPAFFLKRGDIVECEIDGIGSIKNCVN